MITLQQLRALVGKRCESVQRVLNGFEFTYSDGSKLRVSAAWMEFDPAPGKPEHSVGEKVGKSSGEGAG